MGYSGQIILEKLNYMTHFTAGNLKNQHGSCFLNVLGHNLKICLEENEAAQKTFAGFLSRRSLEGLEPPE